MKKDEKTEKENTARGISRGKEFAGGWQKGKREQSTSLSSNTNNSESAPENLPKKNSNFVRISGKKTLFSFCLIVVIVVAGFGYVYRDQVKTVLPNALVEFFIDSSQIAENDTQESIQNEIGIGEMEKQVINSDISEPSIGRVYLRSRLILVLLITMKQVHRSIQWMKHNLF